MTNVPLWWEMSIVREAVVGRGQVYMGTLSTFHLFLLKPKVVSKKKGILKNNNSE